MLRKIKTVVAVLLSVLTLLCFVACGSQITSTEELPESAASNETAITDAVSELESFWQDAKYTEDTVLGEGEVTFMLEVIVGDNHVTFTVNTDKKILGDALLENGLIAGEDSQYGLYVKEVNGITADYNVNQYYWTFTKNGEMMMTGVDGETIKNNAHYEMTCKK